MRIASKLDDFRIKLGISTKKEFAQLFDKSQSEINKWLSGKHNFTVETLVEISCVLSISITDLLADKKQVTISSQEILNEFKNINKQLEKLQCLETVSFEFETLKAKFDHLTSFVKMNQSYSLTVEQGKPVTIREMIPHAYANSGNIGSINVDVSKEVKIVH